MPELYLSSLIVLVGIALFLALHRRTNSRLITAILGLIAVTYGLVVILPFFTYGMHLEDPTLVAGGAFDPKGYPLFSSESEVGSWLHFFALLLLAFTPVAIVVLGVRLANILRRRWGEWQGITRTATLTVLLVSIALFAFMWTPLGNVILAWHFD